MSLHGGLLIGGASRPAAGDTLFGFDPDKRTEIAPAFSTATPGDVADACAMAEEAFSAFSSTSLEARAMLLERIADRLSQAGEAIVGRAIAETGLPETRLRGELGRTTGQLRLFADVLRDGAYLDVRIDHSLPERTPPRPDIRLLNQPIGPVAVFGASNFPLAFSVAGGDTASALAAGCPVVVKAHPAHPGTSELAGRAIQQALEDYGLPAGAFALLHSPSHEIGEALVADPRIQGVGFTGSRRGGLALMAVASTRKQPIPVFAEMSSVNPVVILPGALAERGEAIGMAFAAALNLGAGQFCTNPGLLFVLEGSAIDELLSGVAKGFEGATPGTMLTPEIYEAYCRGVEGLDRHPGVRRLTEGREHVGLVSRPALFEASAADFIADARLSDEVFGAASLLVRCRDKGELIAALTALEGQLTAALHLVEGDKGIAAELVPILERRAGRVLVNGFGTGVEVCDAMVHGGPFPATSDGRSTSVGSLAISRWLRPVCYQDLPPALLPPPVRDDNPWKVPQRVNGVRR